jgi:kynurenine formamidase
MTHLDTVDHFLWDAPDRRPPTSAERATVPAPSDALRDLRNGLLGRGVLADIARTVGGPVPPGHVVTLEDMHRTLQNQGTEVRRGDLLFLRFGRAESRRSDIPLGAIPAAGLSIECAEWLAAAGPSVIITDHGLDPHPSEVAGLPVPWHLLVLTVLRTPLVDMAMLSELAATCERLNRYEFFASIAPLQLPGASGSPVNPLAVF